MVFDIRGNVFVVGMGALQICHAWVRHGIIPPQSLALIGEFVEVLEDPMGDKVNLFEHM